MAARKFKFVSPGVFLKEIDNSQLPKLPGNVGPVIIGRTRKGPALNPVKVNSYAEFVEMFGETVPGNQGDDVWREGNGLLSPAYAHYAAKAYFAADIDSPVTVIRLLGASGDNATSAAGAQAGWSVNKAWALITYPSGSSTASDHTVSAVFYTPATGTMLRLAGQGEGADFTKDSPADFGTSVLTDTNGDFKIIISSTGRDTKEVPVNFRKGSKNYIRSALNTNPVLTNTNVSYITSGTLADKYWLGETFEESLNSASDAKKCGYMVQLQADTTDFEDYTHDASAGRTGWVFSQHEGTAKDYTAEDMPLLFRLIALSEGEEASRNLIVSIEDIRVPETGDTDPYGSFSVVVKKVLGTKLEVVESFTSCNLNPNSQNYVARQIGDQFFQWSSAEKRNKVYGNYPNNSKYIRIEMDSNVDMGAVSPSKVPFGFYGPIIPKRIEKTVASGVIDEIGGASTFIEESTRFKAANVADAGTVTIRWPSLKTTVSASVRGTDSFGAAVYKLSGDNLTSELDTGMIDYIRKMPAGLAKQQTDGISDGSTTEYAFLFSLDEVCLEGSNLTDTSIANVTSSVFVSGSRAATRSSATFTFTTSVPGNGEITLISADGTSKTYIAKDDDVSTNGALDGQKVIFKRGSHEGAETRAAFVATNLSASINSANGHNAGTNDSKFMVDVDGSGGITIRQSVRGATGNKTIATAGNFANATNPAVPSGFTGGRGANADPSYTANHPTNGVSNLLELGFDKFQMPLVGGFDGVDVTEPDPFANRLTSGKTTANSYAFASIDRAIELIKDPELIEQNLVVMPGITTEALTTKLVEKCESRADCLAIIDLPNVYLPAHEKKCKVFSDRIGTTPSKAAKAIKARQLNSSYGATYYPWVKIKDTDSSRDIWVPPSVVALGVMAYTEQRDEVWFAPAGFNRGGLNEGNAGVPVLQVSEQLLSKQRDTLYESSVNPIASFVTEGLVIFGQKTLQTTPSALDRINVRRLLIFVKKEISRIASNLLFDQNVPATWNRFLGQVNPFLQSVKTRLGLSDYKVILDNTTTTPDLVDRNIMYAKIFLKPARAIEFIAVDFVITNTGASFDD
tara:strand:- start:11724 stop:14966 length:3243 start_codon:yes stop_codon:yes gene_type:complete